ncbi:MAG: TlpA family protein disulfide reductase [Burkholderiaceae bacterium]|jgi:peroxiredoxin|nr:TlpA family protein disulfide reductase [Burkholderiaceae bacterium]
MRRRQWLLLGLTGLAAGGLGAWLSTRRVAPTPVADRATEALFAASFPDADGTVQALSQWRGKLLVVNFWATWCPPCVEEMPDLQAARDDYRARGVEIIGIGIDNADKIRAFRDRMKLTLPLLVAGAGGSELGRTLGNQAGALPYTALIDRDGQVVQRKLGQIKPAELRAWLDAQLT